MKKQTPKWAAVKIDGIWRACLDNGEQWKLRDYGVKFTASDNGRRMARLFAAGENRKLAEKAEEPDDPAPIKGTRYVMENIFRPIMGGRLNLSRPRLEGFNMEKIPLRDGTSIDIFGAGRSRTQIPTILKDAVFNYAVVNQKSFEQALVLLLVDGLASQGPEAFDQHLLAAEARRIDAETPPIKLTEEIYR